MLANAICGGKAARWYRSNVSRYLKMVPCPLSVIHLFSWSSHLRDYDGLYVVQNWASLAY